MGLGLRPSGSGVAVSQRPSAGVLSRAGEAIHVSFRRHSELAAAPSAAEEAL